MDPGESFDIGGRNPIPISNSGWTLVPLSNTLPTRIESSPHSMTINTSKLRHWRMPNDRITLQIRHPLLFREIMNAQPNNMKTAIASLNGCSYDTLVSRNTVTLRNDTAGSRILLLLWANRGTMFDELNISNIGTRLSVTGVMSMMKSDLVKVGNRIALSYRRNPPVLYMKNHIYRWLANRDLLVESDILTGNMFIDLMNTSKRDILDRLPKSWTNPKWDQHITRMNYAVYMTKRSAVIDDATFLTRNQGRRGVRKRYEEAYEDGDINSDSRYLLTNEFWKFMSQIEPIYSLLELNDSGTYGQQIINLYRTGILDFSVRLITSNLKELKLLGSTWSPETTRVQVNSISMPRSIITDDQLIEAGISKLDLDKNYRRVEMNIYSSIVKNNILPVIDVTQPLVDSNMSITKVNRSTARLLNGIHILDYTGFDILDVSDPHLNLPGEILKLMLNPFNVTYTGDSNEMAVLILKAIMTNNPSSRALLKENFKDDMKAVKYDISYSMPQFRMSELFEIALMLKKEIIFHGIDRSKAPEPRTVTFSRRHSSGPRSYATARKNGMVYESSIESGVYQRDDLIHLARYPCDLSYSQYIKIREMTTSQLKNLSIMLYKKALPFICMKSSELLFYLTRGYLMPLSDEQLKELNECEIRYRKIAELDDLKLVIMIRLFKLNLSTNLFDILMLLDSPTYQYIDNYANEITAKWEDYIFNNDPHGLAERLDLNHRYMSEENLWRKICDKIKLIHRSELKLHRLDRSNIKSLIPNNMTWFTDMEVEERIGIQNPNSSMYHRRGFFRITNIALSKNRKTLIMDEEPDESTIVIGYGYLDMFVMFDLDDLIASFSRNDTKLFSNPCFSSSPSDYGLISQMRSFTDVEITQLRRILMSIASELQEDISPSVSDINDLDTLLLLIQARTDLMMQANQEIKDLVAEARLLNVADLRIVKQWLTAIFNLGWYFRRWKGPGHPYPLAKHDTERNVNPAVKGTTTNQAAATVVNSIYELERSMSSSVKTFIDRLLVADLTNKMFVTRPERLVTLMKAVLSDQYCIRVSSKLMIVTSFCYLSNIFGFAVEGIDLSKLDSIY
jgi:hypothetical protein